MDKLKQLSWKIIKYLYIIFGYRLTDFSESYKKKNTLEKIYTTTLFTIMVIIIIFDMKITIENKKKIFLYYFYILVMVSETFFCVMSIMIEIHDNQAEKIALNIESIDKILGLEKENLKSKLKSKFVFVFGIYTLYCFFKDTYDYVVWNSYSQIFWSWRMKFGDLIMLKFLTLVHLHLCRLNIFNNHLVKFLKPIEIDCQRSDWLTSWRLYPEYANYYKNTENINICALLNIYGKIFQNMDILTKNMKFMVSNV